MKRVGNGGYQFDKGELDKRGNVIVLKKFTVSTKAIEDSKVDMLFYSKQNAEKSIVREFKLRYGVDKEDLWFTLEEEVLEMNYRRYLLTGTCKMRTVLKELAKRDHPKMGTIHPYELRGDLKPTFEPTFPPMPFAPSGSMHVRQGNNWSKGRWITEEQYREYRGLQTKPENPEHKRMTPTEVIYSGPATICKWTDGSKTVSMCKPGEPKDPLYGFLMCFFKKHSGMNKRGMRKWLNRKVGTSFVVPKKSVKK